jgi:hypothetical protein
MGSVVTSAACIVPDPTNPHSRVPTGRLTAAAALELRPPVAAASRSNISGLRPPPSLSDGKTSRCRPSFVVV